MSQLGLVLLGGRVVAGGTCGSSGRLDRVMFGVGESEHDEVTGRRWRSRNDGTCRAKYE